MLSHTSGNESCKATGVKWVSYKSNNHWPTPTLLILLYRAEKTTEERRSYEQELRENLSKLRFKTQTLFVLEKYSTAEESEPEFLPFTEEHHRQYNELIMGPAQQVNQSIFYSSKAFTKLPYIYWLPGTHFEIQLEYNTHWYSYTNRHLLAEWRDY